MPGSLGRLQPKVQRGSFVVALQARKPRTVEACPNATVHPEARLPQSSCSPLAQSPPKEKSATFCPPELPVFGHHHIKVP